jgi:hypothetical protein
LRKLVDIIVREREQVEFYLCPYEDSALKQNKKP